MTDLLEISSSTPVHVFASPQRTITLLNAVGGTLYYKAGAGVSATSNDGSLTAGQSTTLTASVWVISASFTRIATSLRGNPTVDDGSITSVDLAAGAGGGGSGSGTWKNVKTDYLAVGDGVVDDTAAVQAGINAVKGGDTLYFPPGTYKITSTLDCGDAGGFRLTGAGTGLQYQATPAKLRYTGSTGGTSGGLMHFSNASASGWEIDHLGLEYSNASFTGDLINIDGGLGGGDIADFHIHHCTSRATGTNTAGSIFRLNKTVIGVIEFCHLTGGDHAIRLGDDGGSYVVSVDVFFCTFNFIRTSDIHVGTADGEMLSIRNCIFEAGINTPGITANNCAIYTMLIESCWFGDATGTTTWIDGLVGQSNGYVCTIRNNQFFAGDPVMKLGKGSGTVQGGKFLIQGNGADATTIYQAPGTVPDRVAVIAISNHWIITTSDWNGTIPQVYMTFGHSSGTDLMPQNLEVSGKDLAAVAVGNLRSGAFGYQGGIVHGSGPAFAPTTDIYAPSNPGNDDGLVRIYSGGSGGRQIGFAVGYGNRLGFYGATVVARPAAYTQTYSTADRTHAARTAAALTNSTGQTPDTTIENVPDPADTPASVDALRDDLVANVLPAIERSLADLADMVNKLRADSEDTAQLVNSILDDQQTLGLLQ